MSSAPDFIIVPSVEAPSSDTMKHILNCVWPLLKFGRGDYLQSDARSKSTRGLEIGKSVNPLKLTSVSYCNLESTITSLEKFFMTWSCSYQSSLTSPIALGRNRTHPPPRRPKSLFPG